MRTRVLRFLLVMHTMKQRYKSHINKNQNAFALKTEKVEV